MPDQTTPHVHHGHVHHHHAHDAHGHDPHVHAPVSTGSLQRAPFVPAFSLFALSAAQRLILALPIILALWLATLWAMAGA